MQAVTPVPRSRLRSGVVDGGQKPSEEEQTMSETAMYDPATGDLWAWNGDKVPEYRCTFDSAADAERYCAKLGWSFLDAGTIPHPTPEQVAAFSNKLRRIRIRAD